MTGPRIKPYEPQMHGLRIGASGLGTPWSDKETERALELVEIENLKYREVVERLASEGFPRRTRNAIIGHLWRVRRDADRAEREE